MANIDQALINSFIKVCDLALKTGGVASYDDVTRVINFTHIVTRELQEKADAQKVAQQVKEAGPEEGSEGKA